MRMVLHMGLRMVSYAAISILAGQRRIYKSPDAADRSIVSRTLPQIDSSTSTQSRVAETARAIIKGIRRDPRLSPNLEPRSVFRPTFRPVPITR